jgi:hypothetical protein
MLNKRPAAITALSVLILGCSASASTGSQVIDLTGTFIGNYTATI